MAVVTTICGQKMTNDGVRASHPPVRPLRGLVGKTRICHTLEVGF